MQGQQDSSKEALLKQKTILIQESVRPDEDGNAKRGMIRLLIPLIVLVVAVRVFDPWPIETIRLKYFDFLLTLQDDRDSELIALYDIDEAALAENGQWPWPRSYLADLNSELAERGAIAVVYSVLFPEPDRFLQDGEFALSMQEIPTFLSAVATTSTNRGDGWDIGVATMGPVLENAMQYSGILPNVQALQEASTGTGVVNAAPEVDGLVRRVPALINVQGQLYPALSVDVLRGLAGDLSYQARAGESGIEAVRIPAYDTIQTDSAGRIWIDWNTRFSNNVENKIVYVGVTAAGISPLVPSPVGQLFPHQIQANLLETLLQGSAPLRPDWSLAAEAMGLFVLALSAALLARFLPVYGVAASIFMIGSLTAFGSVWVYLRMGILIDASLPILGAFTVGGAGISQRMAAEYKLKMQIKGQFEHYLDPRQVKKLQDNPELLVLGGEKRYATWIFTDVRGFTSMSERLQPEQVTYVMNRALTVQQACVQKHGGMVDKYIGDALMGAFSIPIEMEHHEEAAVACAREMIEDMKVLNEELKAEGCPSITIGIGISSGWAIVGNMGSEKRFDFTAIGDAVNCGSRLESSTKALAVDCLISEATAKACRFDLRYVQEIEVKGKSESLRVYTL